MSAAERQGAQLDGRTAIILAAEALFAEYGLHGASFRQISEAAGQRNASAIQYHFGSRERLVDAVFRNRMQRTNDRRLSMLEQLDAAGRGNDARALASVWVWPLAEELRPRPEGNHYLRFLATVAREKKLAIEIAPHELMTGLIRATERLRDLIAYLPDPVVQTRLLAAGEQCVNGLAIFEAEGLGGSRQFELTIETLIDMIAASIQAPMSGETQRAMGRGGRAT